jgi:hypothetical protein
MKKADVEYRLYFCRIMQRELVFNKKIGFWLLFLALFSPVSSKPAHPYYISVAEIRADTRQRTLNVACRLFTDDLQDALYRLFQYRAELENYPEQAAAFLEKYLATRLQVQAGGQALHFHFEGYEIREESTWCYLTATDYQGAAAFQVTNRVLYDFLPEQTNIVHLYLNGERRSQRLVQPDDKVQF